MQVRSTIKLNMPRINQLTEAAVKALEMTGEALHTEVVQAQVMPFDTGAMQGDKTFVKAGESVKCTYENGDVAINTITRAHDGKVSLITTAPQARRLYYHPEYDFQKDENPFAGGKWFEPGFQAESAKTSAIGHLRSFTERQVVYDAEINRCPRMDCISWYC